MFDWLKRARQSEHELTQESLSAFLDGELLAGELVRVQRHLQECESCRADLEALRQTVTMLGAAPVVRPQRSFLLPASEGIKQIQARRLRLSYTYLQAATAVATVLLVLVVSGDALLRYAPAGKGWPLSPTTVELTAATAELLLAEAPVASAAEPTSAASEAGKVAAVLSEPTEAFGKTVEPEPDLAVAAPQEGSPDVQDIQAPPESSQPFARQVVSPSPVAGATMEAGPGQPVGAVEPTSEAESTEVVRGVTAVEPTSTLETGVPPPLAAPSSQVDAPSIRPGAEGEPTSEILGMPQVQPTVTSESAGVSARVTPVSESVGAVATEVPTMAPVVSPQPTPLPTVVSSPTATSVPTLAMPVSIQTPVPPTATPMPAQTATALAEVPTVQPVAVGPLAQGPAVPPGSSGLWAWLEARRTLLPWMELILGLATAVLLLVTLWLRRRARWV